MSFTLELAAAWARSPVKAVRNRRRIMEKSTDDEASKRSPTRAMDFPVEEIVDEMLDDEGEAISTITRNDHTSIVRQLSFAPFDIEAPQEITPIPLFQRQRPLKVRALPTLKEDILMETFSPTTITTVIKIKKKAYLPKPSRCEKVQELIDAAEEHAGTGDEEEAIKLYDKAVRVAESELQKLKGQLRKSLDKHPTAVPSIQTRIQQDMLDLMLLSGKIKNDMVYLYERQGDYDNAIEACKEAKSIYKKQKKRSPQLTRIPSRSGSLDLLQQNNSTEADNDSIANSASVSVDSKSRESKSRDSKSSSDSGQSIIWYVECRYVEKLIRSTSILLDRLSKAKASFDDRKKMVEEILMLRQEIVGTLDASERETLYSKVEMMTKNAVLVERSSLGKMHPQIADTLQLLSEIYLEQQDSKPGSRDKAIQYMLQGLEINMKALGSRHPRTGQDLLRMARLYQNPTTATPGISISCNRKDEDRAIEYFRQAAAIFRGVKCGNKVVGSILNDLSVIHVTRREFQAALVLLQESLQSYEADTEEENASCFEDGSRSVNSICIDVVQVWRNIGECRMQLKDFKRAIEAYINALDVQRDARQKHDSISESDDLDSVSDEKSYLFHLMRMINDESIADTLRRLGKAFAAAGKLQEALVVYREAMQIHRTAVHDAMTFQRFRTNPELPGKEDQLASTLFSIAEIYTFAENSVEAVRVFNESMELRISSDNRRPQSQRCNLVHCAMCLVGIANVHSKKGEYLVAHKLYNNALGFCEAQGKIMVNRSDILVQSEHRTYQKNLFLLQGFLSIMLSFR
jgi:tetratricopeptide (TPR) repeat protein